jgi:hypothetical protein
MLPQQPAASGSQAPLLLSRSIAQSLSRSIAVLECDQHPVHLILEQYALLLHRFDDEIADRQVFFLETLDLARQLMVFVIHLAKRRARSFQGVNRIQVLGELVVQVVVLNLHDPSLSLIPAGPMRDQTM